MTLQPGEIRRCARLGDRIEIWFAVDGEKLYMLSGGRDRSDWVQNLLRTPTVTVEIGDHVFAARAKVVDHAEEDERARELVHDKYAPGYGGDLSSWRRSALPVAVDLLEETNHSAATAGLRAAADERSAAEWRRPVLR